MRWQVEYSTLMDLFVHLVESHSGAEFEPGNKWLNDAQVLSIKLYNHLASMQRLAQEVSISIRDAPNVSYIDHASLQVVARAALETYLVFFYIYGTSSESQSHYRHRTWHLAGLIDRQKYSVFSEETREVMIQERKVIQRLKAEIIQSPHFRHLTRSQGRQLLKGFWRVGKTWKDLGKQAGFHERYFENVYNYLCGYSHSSYASALQVRDARSLDDQEILTHGTLGIGIVLMAHFSFTYPCVFPAANSVLSSNPEATQIAETFRFGREDMEEIYGG